MKIIFVKMILITLFFHCLLYSQSNNTVRIWFQHDDYVDINRDSIPEFVPDMLTRWQHPNQWTQALSNMESYSIHERLFKTDGAPSGMGVQFLQLLRSHFGYQYDDRSLHVAYLCLILPVLHSYGIKLHLHTAGSRGDYVPWDMYGTSNGRDTILFNRDTSGLARALNVLQLINGVCDSLFTDGYRVSQVKLQSVISGIWQRGLQNNVYCALEYMKAIQQHYPTIEFYLGDALLQRRDYNRRMKWRDAYSTLRSTMLNDPRGYSHLNFRGLRIEFDKKWADSIQFENAQGWFELADSGAFNLIKSFGWQAGLEHNHPFASNEWEYESRVLRTAQKSRELNLNWDFAVLHSDEADGEGRGYPYAVIPEIRAPNEPPTFSSVLNKLYNFYNPTTTQQQTYTLETSTFRLVFNRFNVPGDGYATGIRECRYLPTNRTFLTHERATCIARVDTSWDFPISTSVSQIAPNIKELTVNFSAGRSITMRITSHLYFLEFELLTVTGDCRDIWLFAPIFLGLSPADWPGWDSLGMNHYEYNQITYLGSGYYACLIAANPNTYIYRNWADSTSVFITAISPKYLPTRGGASYRNQRFAFFLCREEDIKNRVREVEQYFNFPYGIELKDNPENNIDYLFLIDESYVPAHKIIQLCRLTNLGAVLLYQGYWSAWRAPDEPFKLHWWTSNVVDSLKAAGLIVGLHSYVHLVPYEGYFATHYPDSVSTCIVEGFKLMKWTTSLPDSVVHRFVEQVQILQPDWLYFDGVGPLDVETCQGGMLDHYLGMRQTDAILRELRMRNYGRLKIFQEASGTLPYHFTSRIGQTDYWDGAPWHRNPIGHMNFTASQSIHRRRGLYKYTDLGWFGRDIHVYPSGNRDATWQEWQHLANTSLTYNIPVGIRTTYNDFMTDSLRNRIIPLLRETIRLRRGLVGISVEVVSGWNLLSNPVTVIGDSVLQLFPSSQYSYALFYDSSGSYTQSYRLKNGVGYWLNFLSSGTYFLGGVRRLIDTVEVRQGWNMIGSISEPIVTTQISSIPSGIITSQFFHYVNNSYVRSDTIQPGKGYWVKVNSSGKLVLGTSTNPISVVPIAELPPPPPEVVDVPKDENLPRRFALHQNYPNPFNPETWIDFELPLDCYVRLVIYDPLGREVDVVINEPKKAGFHKVLFNGSKLSSGVYFYRLHTNTFNDAKKFLLLK